METFNEVQATSLTDNPFDAIGERWMLVTAGAESDFNTMTASWGGWGVLWDRPVCFVFVRPTRHTYRYMERNDRFTLCFLDDAHRDVLAFCGAQSGRDTDKIAKTGLIPRTTESGGVFFDQARLVMECVKLYAQDLDPSCMVRDEPRRFYGADDYHRMYVGEAVRCLKR